MEKRRQEQKRSNRSFVLRHDELTETMVLDIMDPDGMLPLVIKIHGRPYIKAKTLSLTGAQKLHLT